MHFTTISPAERQEIVIRAILDEFERGLRSHLFSDKSLPESVSIRTEYPESTNRVVIRFGDPDD